MRRSGVTRASPGCVRGFTCGLNTDIRARSQSRPQGCGGPSGARRVSRAAQRAIASWSPRPRPSCVGPLVGMWRPGKAGVRPSRRRRRAPARRGGAGARRATALSRVLALCRLHPDVLTDAATAVDQTVGIVPASGTGISRARAHEHPCYLGTSHHRITAVSVRENPRSVDLLELEVFGRGGEATVVERNLELANDGGRVPGTPGFVRQRRAGPHGRNGKGVRSLASEPAAKLRRRGSAGRRGVATSSRACVRFDSTVRSNSQFAYGLLRITRGCAGRRLGGARVRTRTGCARRHRRRWPLAHAAADGASGALSRPDSHRIMAARCTGRTRLIARAG